MPSRGVVNNPSGTNSFSGPGGEETPYGAVKRLAQSIRMAPISKNPALNEPRRSKNRAKQAPVSQVEPHPLNQPAPVQQDPQAMKSEFWSYLASVVPDPLIQEFAGNGPADFTGEAG